MILKKIALVSALAVSVISLNGCVIQDNDNAVNYRPPVGIGQPDQPYGNPAPGSR